MAAPLTESKCWICLTAVDEPAPDGSHGHRWRRPCTCNLIAHESCLLDWTAEVAANGSSTNSVVRGHGIHRTRVAVCPQCRSEIRVVQSRSLVLGVRDWVESVNKTALQVAFFGTVGGSVASAAYTTLYALGASAIRGMCPTPMALDLLGVLVTEGSIELQPLTVRRLLLVPLIPVGLCLAESRLVIVDALFMLAPLALADRQHPPWRFRGARLTLAVLPVIRLVYQTAYDVVVKPRLARYYASVRPDAHLPQAEPMFRLVVQEDEEANEGENEAGQENAAQAPAVARPGLRDRIVFNVVEFAAAMVEMFVDPAERPVVAPVPEWIVSKRSLTLRIGHALLLPLLAGMAGSGLSHFPLLRRLIPDRFNRNVVGGILVILVRDLVNLYTARERVRSLANQRVLNYNERSR